MNSKVDITKEIIFASSDSNVSSVIASDFSGTVTSSTMAKNKWGYSLDNTDFLKIPTLNNQESLWNSHKDFFLQNKYFYILSESVFYITYDLKILTQRV